MVLASTYPRWEGDPEPGFVHELSRRLAADFDVTVVAPHAPGSLIEEHMQGVEVLRFRYAPEFMETLVHGGGIVANLRRYPWKWLLLPLFFGSLFLAVRKQLRNHRFVMIHAHWLIPQGLVAMMAGSGRDVPYVVTSHGGDLFGLQGKLMSHLKCRIARSSRGITVVSGAMRQQCEKLGVKPDRVEVISMGADLSGRFTPEESIFRVRNELLFVGRLVEKKGLNLLLDALPQVISRVPDLTLRIVGYGPMREALEDQVQRLGIGDVVTFVGALPQDRLPDCYRRASLFVAPFVRDKSGDQDGLPVALMEAIGCDCPVVVGCVEGVEDLLGQEDSDAVPVGDVACLAQRIVDSLVDYPGATRRAVLRRERIQGQFDWSNVASRYSQWIQDRIST